MSDSYNEIWNWTLDGGGGDVSVLALAGGGELSCTPYESIATVVRSIGQEHLSQLIQFLSKCMEDSPHVEYYLQWCLELLQTHGLFMEKNRGKYLRSFRALFRVVQSRDVDLKSSCDDNKYLLDFLENQAKLLLGGQNES